MNISTLHENWKMRIVGENDYISAVVPGSVYNDLLLNNRMEDPYYRDNELKALKIMDNDFEYVTTFNVDENILSEEEIILHFDGLDTIADIFLNGEWIAYVENMHRTWEFSVKKLLKRTDNELKIIFYSPTKFIKEAYKKNPLKGTSDAMVGFTQLRKAHCMFGWDWGPRLPDAGIWRSVSLIGFSNARLDSVYITQHHIDGNVSLSFEVDVEKLDQELIRRFGVDDNRLVGLSYRVTVTSPDGESRLYSYEEASNGINIENPQLWWPTGYGEQPLYWVKVELLEGNKVLDSWNKRIGLRTLSINIEKDEYGEQFCHIINGVKIFAMGADYIPEDNILPRVNPERTYNLLLQAKNANHNCVRVWGGGYYPYDAFYDICDELGLIVWQDFMFACAIYELNDKFEENITAEFIDNIKRIRHHASLGLWCGNNEMEIFVKQRLWVTSDKQVSDYVKMYEYVLPKICKEFDPNTFFWPASPSSGGAFDNPNDENRGDVHYWDVWHGNKPFSDYRKYFFRYVSEFGFQSFPSLKTCESFTEPQDRNIFSYVMEKHQRNSSANGKIMNYMEQTFLYPCDFDTTLYASQLLQADAVRYGIEHFRRNRGRCMGTIVWQLNDCWPVASWASIDYFGRWKALHYAEKRAFAPIMISCEEEGILTQDSNPNAEPYVVKKSIHLNVANESMKDVDVTIKWALRNAKAEIKRQGETKLHIPSLSAIWLPKEDMMDADLYNDYASFDCYIDDKIVSSGTVLFCPPKHFNFIDPELSVSVEGDELIVKARAHARSIEIINEEDNLLLDDNYFDMNAGERRIKILSGKPDGLKIRSVFNIR